MNKIIQLITDLFKKHDAKLEEIKVAVEGKKAAEATSAEAQARIAELETDLEAEKLAVEAIEKDLTEAKAQMEKAQAELKVAQAAIKDPNGEIEKKASLKAAEIVAAQGAPPVKTADSASHDQTDDLSHLKGLDRAAAAIARDFKIV